MAAMSKIAVVTGASQGLGFALVEGLAQRLDPSDVVYLTGRGAPDAGNALGRTRPSVRRDQQHRYDPATAGPESGAQTRWKAAGGGQLLGLLATIATALARALRDRRDDP